MKVLVAYGSKMGGTAGIADTIGQTLTMEGDEVDIRPGQDVRSVDDYDVVIVGGGLYANRWQKNARTFVKRNAEELKRRPVWMFSSGPLDDSAGAGEIPPTSQVQGLMEKVSARGHATFGGRLPVDAKGFPASSMAKQNAGDWRDSAHVEAWAKRVRASLRSAEQGYRGPEDADARHQDETLE